jgi:hypothetical protein
MKFVPNDYIIVSSNVGSFASPRVHIDLEALVKNHPSVTKGNN